MPIRQCRSSNPFRKEKPTTKAKSLLATDILTLFSTAAFASPLPSEVYRPTGSHAVKADRQDGGEFGYRAEPSGRHNSTPSLAKKVIAHARSKSFHMVESEIKHDDTDLKFKRGRQELDVSIEDKD